MNITASCLAVDRSNYIINDVWVKASGAGNRAIGYQYCTGAAMRHASG
jgi:hypothetical protein